MLPFTTTEQNKKREIEKRKKEKFEVEMNEIVRTKKLKLDNAAEAESATCTKKAILDAV